MIGYNIDFVAFALLAAMLVCLVNFNYLSIVVPRYLTWYDQFILRPFIIILGVSGVDLLDSVIALVYC